LHDLKCYGQSYSGRVRNSLNIRQLHISAGLHKQFSLQLTPRLKQVLRGIKRVIAATHTLMVVCKMLLAARYVANSVRVFTVDGIRQCPVDLQNGRIFVAQLHTSVSLRELVLS